MAGEVNDLYLHYRLPKLILKVQLSVQTEWKKNHEIIFLLFNLLNFVPKKTFDQRLYWTARQRNPYFFMYILLKQSSETK